MSEQEIEVGRTYKVNHSRKGKFSLCVTKVDGEWVTGTITGGAAHFMTEDSRTSGEDVTVRRCLSTFTPA